MRSNRTHHLALTIMITMMVGVPAQAADVRILDGDTFELGKETIRIANIDAPETVQAKCDAERRLGLVAKRRLADLLSTGQLEIRRGDPATGRQTDRYNRTLATVMVAGKDVGATLVAEMLARPWKGKRRPWCLIE